MTTATATTASPAIPTHALAGLIHDDVAAMRSAAGEMLARCHGMRGHASVLLARNACVTAHRDAVLAMCRQVVAALDDYLDGDSVYPWVVLEVINEKLRPLVDGKGEPLTARDILRDDK